MKSQKKKPKKPLPLRTIDEVLADATILKELGWRARNTGKAIRFASPRGIFCHCFLTALHFVRTGRRILQHEVYNHAHKFGLDEHEVTQIVRANDRSPGHLRRHRAMIMSPFGLLGP